MQVLVQLGDLSDAHLVLAAVERGVQERVHNLLGHFDAGAALAQRQHVGVVVLPSSTKTERDACR